MTFIVRDTESGREREVDTRAKAEATKEELEELGLSVEIVAPETSTDGGATESVTPEVVDNTESDEAAETAEYDLPDKPRVDEDPLVWMPEEFTDTIDDTVAINRKGYEVMAHHYGIGTQSRCLVGPEETGFTFCRVEATAVTDDNTRYAAHGSAHTDRGDDSWLLLEMADTRARKRAIAQATGVGMAAVEELRTGLEGGE